MIVKMNKITLAVLSKDKDKFLSLLRKKGVVHIKHLAKPEDQAITGIEEEESQIKKAISILAVNSGKKKQLSDSRLDSNKVFDKAKEIIFIQREKEDLLKNILDTKAAIEWYKPWGSFVPKDLLGLKENNIYLKLYRANKKQFKELTEKENIYVVNKGKNYVYMAGVFRSKEEELPFDEVSYPNEGPAELNNKLELYIKKEKELEQYLAEQVSFKIALEEYIVELQKKHNFLEVFHGMQSENEFSLVQGFCPKPKLQEITSLAKQENIGYLIEEPDSIEETPTYITNPKWIRIINPVFKFMNTVPGYKEFDISLVFLVFFSIFFAMLIGDAGYGFIFLSLTFYARHKLKNLPYEPFFLMYILSIATIIWGVITGTWFGCEQIAKLPIFSNLTIQCINSFVDSNQDFIMYLCFVIGAVHLTIAHLMRFFRMINSLKCLAQLGWVIIMWGLFFLAGKVVVNKPLPGFTMYLFIAGITLILLFSNPQKNIIKGILISLANLPLSIISSFADVMSYIRLFAVGYASVAVSSNFNNMAMGAGFGNIFYGLLAVLILVAGHSLNIMLGMMAVIVHGIRLNMLEFGGHLDMQWSGTDYAPFSES